MTDPGTSSAHKEPTVSPPLVPRSLLIPFVLLVCCFALWGLANNLTDTLLATFRKVMSMSDFQTSWIQVAFYGSYFVLALPAALLVRRSSYKTGVLVGLGLFALGALGFYPASETRVYAHFLIALFVLAAGLSILETAANPYILAMGPEQTAVRRLNLAQAFNPVGSIAGVIIGKLFILDRLDDSTAEQRAAMGPEALAAVQNAELSAVMLPYVSIAAVIALVWIVIACWPLPKNKDDNPQPLGAVLLKLGRRPRYALGVVAQFFYVGAQIGVWSYTIRYVQDQRGLNEGDAGTWYLASIILFSVSRFVFTALMSKFSPAALLAFMASAGMVTTAAVALVGGLPGVIALVMTSACMSLMFPTIYGIALTGLAEDMRKIGAAGLIMAILGGAVLTSVQGRISDAAGIQAAFWVPTICFIVILAFALYATRLRSEPNTSPS